MWQSVLQAVREGLSVALQQHQTMGLLLALYEAGYAGPLLVDGSRICRRRCGSDYAVAGAGMGACRGWRKCSFSARSTLRRRLQQESQSFRQIVEEVRMAHALGQLQTTSRPIGEVAQNSGYQSGSRFTARLPSALWFTAEACTLSEFAILSV